VCDVVLAAQGQVERIIEGFSA
ncbi:phenylphosphate carboxylase subunit delta, partial [Xanthomonas oryzae pv. oryzae]